MAVLGCGLVLAPRAAVGQDSGASQGQPGLMVAYARAYLAITTARDQAQAAFAAPKNKKPEAQAELRDTLDVRIAAALAAQGLTRAQFDSITRVISTDAVQRKAFDAALARLSPAKPDAPSPGP